MFEIEAEKRTKNCQEAYNKGFKEGYECGYNKANERHNCQSKKKIFK